MEFNVKSSLNRYMRVGGTRVDVAISVEASGQAEPSQTPLVFGLLLDTSTSMEGEFIQAARHAARVAIDALPANAHFFVISFNHQARAIVPICRATPENKENAHNIIRRLDADGDTFISTGLKEIRNQIANCKNAIVQVALLTDGRNNTKDASDLAKELSLAGSSYQAFCRGIGTGWSPTQLRMIAEKLMGNAQMVAEPNKLAEDFQNIMQAAMKMSARNVRLRLWTPRSSVLKSIHQATPVDIDLTDKMVPVDQRSFDVLLGAWGEGVQDYVATFEVAPNTPGVDVLVYRPSIIYDGANGPVEVKGDNVVVQWTNDNALSASIDSTVAHYTGQAEKAQAIQEGLEALGRGDEATATVRLGRARQLAIESGDTETTQRIEKIVEVVDQDIGTVKVRRGNQHADLMDLDVSSTKAVRANRTK
jgi:uncharacterized protein YegL